MFTTEIPFDVLAHRANRRAHRVWIRSRIQADWEEHKVARSRAQLVYAEHERS